MINPYILKHTSRTVPVDFLEAFLRDYFFAFHRLHGNRIILPIHATMLHNLEDETMFPLWIARDKDGCCITRDPGVIPDQRYHDVQMLNWTWHNTSLLRARRTLTSALSNRQANDSAQTVIPSCCGWLTIEEETDAACPLLLVRTSSGKGILDPFGKEIVPPVYQHIVPMALKSNEFSLLVCRKGNADTNTTDVYDLNGNCIYRGIGGFYRHTDTVKYTFVPEEGNQPCIRFAEEVCIVMYDEEYAKHTTYIRPTHLLCFAEPEPKDGAPKRLHGVESRATALLETETYDLLEIKDILQPILEVMGEWRDETPEEVMLSIPVWNVARQTDSEIDDITADTQLIDIAEMTVPCYEHLRAAGIHTVAQLASADLATVCKNLDEQIALEAYIMQGRIVTTFRRETK